MSTASHSPDSGPPRPMSGGELTAVSIITGLVLSVVMGAANVYLGLRVGMTVSASIPAAVLASGLLRGVFRRGSILEANIVQTSASAGESLAAGIIFTMPALILTETWQEFDFWTTTLVALSGGLLGILMMIPMRRAIVIEAKELKFPEGIACAEVLNSGAGDNSDEAASGSRLVFGGLAAGIMLKLLGSFVGIFREKVDWATHAAGRTWYAGTDISPALISVGLIIGLPIATQVFLGGALSWAVLIPLLSAGADITVPAMDIVKDVRGEQVRFVGVGAMIVGGVAAIWKVRGGISAAIRELTGQFRTQDNSSESPAGDSQSSERNLELKWLIPLAVVCAAVIFGVYFTLLQKSLGIALIATVAALVLSFFFTAVASYIVGLVGNSNSPVSGMTISAVLITGLLLYLAGYTGSEGILATLGVAGIVCCVACTSGDVCNDLKTGQIVGASPRSQQIVQVLGVLVAAFVMAPVMTVLHEGSLKAGNGGIGVDENLPAPQAGLFATLAEGFFGGGSIPWDLVGWGAGIGLLILLGDIPLAKRNSSFRLHVMPVAVGIYLPPTLTVPILLGGLLHHFLKRGAGESQLFEKRGVLLASGIIAGESLTGVALGFLAFMDQHSLELAQSLPSGVADGLSLIVLAVVCGGIWFVSSQQRPSN